LTVCRYYTGLTRALSRRPIPANEEELRYWYLAQIVFLWDRVCTADGETFAQYVQRSGVRLPVAWLRRRAAAVCALYAWPAIAIALVTRRRDRAVQLGRALRRPDLYATFPAMAFSEDIVRRRRSDMFVAVFNAWHYAATRSDSYAIEDKRVFARRARAHGLPVVPELTPEEARALPGPFIVKDPSQDRGLGVRRVEDSAGLSRLSDVERLIIQPCLENHPDLLPLLPPQPPLCTLRLTTTWDRDAADCHIAYFRIGESGGAVDNVSRGGLFVEVDLRAGTLLSGLTHAMLHGRETPRAVGRAPGARRDLSGATLPHFAAARALCQRAHALLAPDILSIGWDIALRRAGPILVEANVFAGSFEVRQLADSYGRTTREVLRRLGSRPGSA
jgi:hypothetical protein